MPVNRMHDASSFAFKGRFAGLDALRGVASFSVMWMHLRGIFSPGGAIVHAGLAVDLFFMLSGFVIAYAYGAKLAAGMSWSAFMVRRIVRLYPMLLLGVLSGFVVLMTKQALHAPLEPEQQAINLVPNLLLIPVGLLYSHPTYPFDGPALFAFDGPMWSLFFEFFVYSLFALPIWRRLRTTSTLVVILAASTALLFAGWWSGQITDLGLHGLIGFLGAFPRAVASFVLGTLLYSTSAFERFPRLPFAVPALVVVLVLNVPFDASWRVDAVLIFSVFPLVICLTARSHSGWAMSRIGNFIGRLSYPVYLLHVPIAISAGFVLKTIFVGMSGYRLVFACALLTLLASWLALVAYDEPVRRALLGRPKGRRSPSMAIPSIH